MQKQADNQDFDYHFVKNDMNRYTEAYMKYKNTMRDSKGHYTKEK